MGALQVMLLRLVLLAASAATTAVTVTAAPPPSEVAVGALFTYDSTIGRAARLAIELAVDDVNADRTVLAGTRLNLLAQDTNCSGFLGAVEGWFFFNLLAVLSSRLFILVVLAISSTKKTELRISNFFILLNFVFSFCIEPKKKRSNGFDSRSALQPTCLLIRVISDC